MCTDMPKHMSRHMFKHRYERLKKYQRLYEERERKWNTYSDGEDLFGLPVTEYPELVKTKKELEFLDRL